jgi:hypothetical protein
MLIHHIHGKTVLDIILTLYNVFGLRNVIVSHLLIPHFIVWFVEWDELIYHHFIPYRLTISNNTRDEFIPPNLWNGLMMQHLISNKSILQTKHPRSVFLCPKSTHLMLD